MLFCEHCKGIINSGDIFYDIHDKFYCKDCIIDEKGVLEVKDTNISINTNHKFFVKNQARKFKNFDECIRSLENDIFYLEDSLSYCKEKNDKDTKKSKKTPMGFLKYWETKVEDKKKILTEFEKAISQEGTLF